MRQLLEFWLLYFAMPRIYGIDVHDNSLAKNAKWLMHAQVAICGVGMLSGVAGLLNYFVSKSTLNDWLEESGSSNADILDDQQSSSMNSIVVLNDIIVMLLPMILILIVRFAIQNNSRELMTGICVFEGICSFFSAWGVFSAVVAIPYYFHAQQYIKNYDCETSKACESAKDPTISLLNVAVVFGIIQMIFSICQVIACAMGTLHANAASQTLITGQVFIGPPKHPVVAIVAVGRPASNEQNNVVVGVPV
jgi:hypothetical protein